MKNWIATARYKTALFIALVMLIPLSITLYTWQVTKENIHEATQIKFEALVKESEKALLHRMDSYKQALLGGRGFYEGSSNVNRGEWKAYVRANDVLTNFPGINGIGTIYDVPDSELEAFEKEMRADGYPNFAIHPAGNHPENFIIKYIEPLDINKEAIGLNIGFEANRREAAKLSRDTGKPAITKRILLVQDAEKTPGFLLFLPVYHKGLPANTLDERRIAFSHWIYAPFIGKNFLKDLTGSQGKSLHFQVYDEAIEDQENLIFDSNSALSKAIKPRFVVKKNIEIMQQNWLLSWSSTSEFERIENSNEPKLILILGFLFTGLFTVFAIVMVIRTETDQHIAHVSYFIPVIAFFITASAGYLLSKEILHKERSFIQSATKEAARSIADTINQNVSSRILALSRMADRWITRGGTPFNEWQKDAQFYVKDQPGVKAVEWVDSTYHVRWVEPERGNKKAVGLNIIFNEEREKALKGAANKNSPTVTSPLDLVQGYKAFIAYFPLNKSDGFDGFIASIFGIEELLNASLSGANLNDFTVELLHDGKVFYNSSGVESVKEMTWVAEAEINIIDNDWTLRVYPRSIFIEQNSSFLPDLILTIGLVLGLMVGLIIDSAQRSKVKSKLLSEQENLLSTFIKHTPAAVAMFDTAVKYIAASDRWYAEYGLNGQDIIGKSHYEIFPEILKNHPKWLDIHQRVINGEIIKEDEEAFTRSDGRVEWLRYELRPWSKGMGEKGGLIMFTENITERKQIETMKDEFISTVNHELRTPLTSIQISLGLLKEDSEKLDDDDKRVLELAYNNCERLTHLVNDILDIEKIAAGKMEYAIEETEMVSLIKDTLDHNQGFANKYGVQFELESTFEAVHANVDRNRFTQALINLLSNAAKFSPKNDVVTVKLASEGKRKLRISVSDNGPGIPEDFKKIIFTKFAQADSSTTRSKGGTGLGLNITKSIIEAFGGEVTFESKNGKGATFHFVLPVCEPNKTKEA